MIVYRSLFLGVFLFLISGASYSWATPAREIKLDYDKEKKILHVEAQHPSDRLERHYQRRLSVKLNGVEATTVNYPRQKLAWGFSEDIALEAKGDDVIAVELFCSQGGQDQAEIKIPPDPNEEKIQEGGQSL